MIQHDTTVNICETDKNTKMMGWCMPYEDTNEGRHVSMPELKRGIDDATISGRKSRQNQNYWKD